MADKFETLARGTLRNESRFRTNFEAIIAKYDRHFDCDEIDLYTLKVVRDSGQLKSDTFCERKIGHAPLATDNYDKHSDASGIEDFGLSPGEASDHSVAISPQLDFEARSSTSRSVRDSTKELLIWGLSGDPGDFPSPERTLLMKQLEASSINLSVLQEMEDDVLCDTDVSDAETLSSFSESESEMESIYDGDSDDDEITGFSQSQTESSVDPPSTPADDEVYDSSDVESSIQESLDREQENDMTEEAEPIQSCENPDMRTPSSRIKDIFDRLKLSSSKKVSETADRVKTPHAFKWRPGQRTPSNRPLSAAANKVQEITRHVDDMSHTGQRTPSNRPHSAAANKVQAITRHVDDMSHTGQRTPANRQRIPANRPHSAAANNVQEITKQVDDVSRTNSRSLDQPSPPNRLRTIADPKSRKRLHMPGGLQSRGADMTAYRSTEQSGDQYINTDSAQQNTFQSRSAYRSTEQSGNQYINTDSTRQNTFQSRSAYRSTEQSGNQYINTDSKQQNTFQSRSAYRSTEQSGNQYINTDSKQQNTFQSRSAYRSTEQSGFRYVNTDSTRQNTRKQGVDLQGPTNCAEVKPHGILRSTTNTRKPIYHTNTEDGMPKFALVPYSEYQQEDIDTERPFLVREHVETSEVQRVRDHPYPGDSFNSQSTNTTVDSSSDGAGNSYDVSDAMQKKSSIVSNYEDDSMKYGEPTVASLNPWPRLGVKSPVKPAQANNNLSPAAVFTKLKIISPVKSRPCLSKPTGFCSQDFPENYWKSSVVPTVSSHKLNSHEGMGGTNPSGKSVPERDPAENAGRKESAYKPNICSLDHQQSPIVRSNVVIDPGSRKWLNMPGVPEAHIEKMTSYRNKGKSQNIFSIISTKCTHQDSGEHDVDMTLSPQKCVEVKLPGSPVNTRKHLQQTVPDKDIEKFPLKPHVRFRRLGIPTNKTFLISGSTDSRTEVQPEHGHHGDLLYSGFVDVTENDSSVSEEDSDDASRSVLKQSSPLPKDAGDSEKHVEAVRSLAQPAQTSLKESPATVFSKLKLLSPEPPKSPVFMSTKNSSKSIPEKCPGLDNDRLNLDGKYPRTPKSHFSKFSSDGVKDSVKCAGKSSPEQSNSESPASLFRKLKIVAAKSQVCRKLSTDNHLGRGEHASHNVPRADGKVPVNVRSKYCLNSNPRPPLPKGSSGGTVHVGQDGSSPKSERSSDGRSTSTPTKASAPVMDISCISFIESRDLSCVNDAQKFKQKDRVHPSRIRPELIGKVESQPLQKRLHCQKTNSGKQAETTGFQLVKRSLEYHHFTSEKLTVLRELQRNSLPCKDSVTRKQIQYNHECKTKEAWTPEPETKGKQCIKDSNIGNAPSPFPHGEYNVLCSKIKKSKSAQLHMAKSCLPQYTAEKSTNERSKPRIVDPGASYNLSDDESPLGLLLHSAASSEEQPRSRNITGEVKPCKSSALIYCHERITGRSVSQLPKSTAVSNISHHRGRSEPVKRLSSKRGEQEDSGDAIFNILVGSPTSKAKRTVSVVSNSTNSQNKRTPRRQHSRKQDVRNESDRRQHSRKQDVRNESDLSDDSSFCTLLASPTPKAKRTCSRLERSPRNHRLKDVYDISSDSDESKNRNSKYKFVESKSVEMLVHKRKLRRSLVRDHREFSSGSQRISSESSSTSEDLAEDLKEKKYSYRHFRPGRSGIKKCAVVQPTKRTSDKMTVNGSSKKRPCKNSSSDEVDLAMKKASKLQRRECAGPGQCTKSFCFSCADF